MPNKYCLSIIYIIDLNHPYLAMSCLPFPPPLGHKKINIEIEMEQEIET